MDHPVRRKRAKSPEATRLEAADWIHRGLEVLAERGVEGVRVEVLAKQLEVTKGSFYWHFEDRPALLEAMLQEWRRRATLGIIERLERTHEPAPKRLARLLRLQFDAKHAEIGAEIELSVRLWGRHDPKAARVLQEIDELRLRYIGGLLEESGIAKETARARAVLIYCYMRVSRSLAGPTVDRATIQLCEQLLTEPA
jgi:AcrR family transcriptional regulator